MTRVSLAVITAIAFAVPVVAFAKEGADDGTRTTSTPSTTHHRSAAKKLTAAQRRRAIAAARARVGASAKVLNVARRGNAIRVRLVRNSTRYDVRVSLGGKVRSVTTKASDDPATHDAGDDHGSGGHGADDGPNHS
jgi:hypothetical protein